MRYRGFISYSQKDKVWGARLHHWLERYRVPKGVRADVAATRRLGRFFRDDDEMAATADIAARVLRALEESESLIVICSPRSACSRWVASEIEYFRRTGRGDKIFAFIIDGEPNSGNMGTECFPPPFRILNPKNSGLSWSEPLGLDVRKDGRARVCARLAAGLLEVDFDDLWQRDRRWATTRQRWWIGGLGTATVAFAGLAASAMKFGLAARKSARRAEAERANLLANTSSRFIEEGNIAEALGYAAAALEIAQSSGVNRHTVTQAEAVTRQALMVHHTSRVRLAVTYRGHDGRVTDVVTSADGRLVATAGDDGVARLYERNTGALLKEIRHEAPLVSILFFKDDQYLLSATKDGGLKATSVVELDRSLEAAICARLLGMQSTPAGDAVLVCGLLGRVALWFPIEGRLDELRSVGPILRAEFLADHTGKILLDHGTSTQLISLYESDWQHRFSGACSGRDPEQSLISSIDNEGVEVFDLSEQRVVSKFEARGILSTVVEGRADRIVWYSARRLEFRSLSTAAQICKHDVPWAIKGILKAPTGNRIIIWGQETARVFNLDGGQAVFDIKPWFEILDGDVSDTTGRLLLRGNKGRAAIWSLVDGAELKRIEGRGVIRDSRFNEDGRSVWLNWDSGELQVVALDEGAINGRFFHGDTILGWKILPDSSEFLTWSADGTAKSWSWRPTPSCYLFQPPLRPSRTVVNSEAGVAFSSEAEKLVAWRLDDGAILAQCSLGVEISDITPSNDGTGVLLLGSKRVYALNMMSGEQIWKDTDISYAAFPYGPNSFALYDKAKTKLLSINVSRVSEGLSELDKDVLNVFLMGSRKALVVAHTNGEVKIYVGATLDTPVTLTIGRELAYCVGSLQENRLVAVATDGSITVVDLHETLTVASVWLPPVCIPLDERRAYNPLQFDRDIYFVGNAGKLIWLDPVERSVVRDETTPDKLDLVKLSGDGQKIATFGDRKNFVQLMDRNSEDTIRLEHRSIVLGLQFVARGKKIATWSANRLLKIWEVNGVLNHELPHFGIVSGVTVTPDDEILVSWTDTCDIAYWELRSGAKLFEMRVADDIREVSFLRSPDRMLVTFKHACPTLMPFFSRNHLMECVLDLIAVLRPSSQRELSNSEAEVNPDRALVTTSTLPAARRGSTSTLVVRDLLASWDGTVELGVLADGQLLLVSDKPFDHILQLVEYNEFEQLLSVYAVDGSASTMALPIPPYMLDAMRRQKKIVVFILFPDHEPIGYKVPLARQ